MSGGSQTIVHTGRPIAPAMWAGPVHTEITRSSCDIADTRSSRSPKRAPSGRAETSPGSDSSCTSAGPFATTASGLRARAGSAGAGAGAANGSHRAADRACRPRRCRRAGAAPTRTASHRAAPSARARRCEIPEGIVESVVPKRVANDMRLVWTSSGGSGSPSWRTWSMPSMRHDIRCMSARGRNTTCASGHLSSARQRANQTTSPGSRARTSGTLTAVNRPGIDPGRSGLPPA